LKFTYRSIACQLTLELYSRARQNERRLLAVPT